MSLFDELRRRNVVRVAAGYIVLAWLVVQVVETILPAFGFGDEAVRFVVIGFAVGFIPVVVLAWVFEWTPEGIKVDEGAEQRGPAVAAAAKRWDRVVMIVLAIAVTYFVVEKIILSQDAEPSIAVLPFVSTSADPDKAFYGIGIADEVHSLLAKVPQVIVASKTSSFAYAAQGLTVKQIGEKAQVDHILEGSVRQAGDRVRVSAQLIDTRTDRNLWSGTWESSVSDVFKIQDDIVADIISQMNVVPDRALPKSRQTDPAALALFLKAKQIYFENYGGQPEPGASERMRELLEGALEIDPEYAPAISWLALADYFAILEGQIGGMEAQSRYEELKDRVLAIDPNDAMMLMMLAYEQVVEHGDLEAAAPLFERALYHGPNEPELLRIVAKFGYLIGHYPEAEALLERALRVDPLCTSCLSELGQTYMRSGELDKGIAVRGQLQKLNSGRGLYYFALMHLMQGNIAAARSAFEEMGKTGSYAAAGLAMVHHSLGEFEEADSIVSSLIAQSDMNPGIVAEVEAWRGNADDAFYWLGRAIESPLTQQEKFGGAMNYVGRPIFTELQDDPRWAAFREAAGMSPERLDALDVDLRIPE